VGYNIVADITGLSLFV